MEVDASPPGGGGAPADLLYGIEEVLLSERDDTVVVNDTERQTFQSKLLVDGGDGTDTLDLSELPLRMFIGSAKKAFFSFTAAPDAIELYGNWEPQVQYGLQIGT